MKTEKENKMRKHTPTTMDNINTMDINNNTKKNMKKMRKKTTKQ